MAKQINFGGHLIRQFGAYIRTDLSALTEINGVGSGIIGVVGLAAKGPVNTPVTVNGYTQLVEIFGDGPLVRHGLAMYVGGASTLVAMRIGSPTPAVLDVITINPLTNTAGDSDIYRWEAVELGELGNNVYVSVRDRDNADDTDPGDTFTITIRYMDAQGNDIREVFVVPRTIPDPRDWYGPNVGRYYTSNVDEYYLLRDRYTGIIREVPDTWGVGNVDEEAFLDKVSGMKSTDEDLIGPFYFDPNGENIYPLALIGTVINYGGLGYARSQFARIAGMDPSIAEIIDPNFVYDPNSADTFIAHPFLNLARGHNGDDGTNFYGFEEDDGSGGFDMNWNATYNITDPVHGVNLTEVWGQALGIMEDEEVNFIQPAYLFNQKNGSNTLNWSVRKGFFDSLMPLFISHVNTMSNTVNRRFRTSVVGVPYYRKGPETANNTEADFLDDIQSLSGLLNNDRFQCWVGGFKSRAFSPALEEYGADMLASFVVGEHASREVSTSLSFAGLAGIFTDGLEFRFNQAQKDELYARGLPFAMKRRTAAGAVEYVAAHNYTTFTGSPSQGLNLFLTRRIVDYTMSFVYKNVEETFIGAKSYGAETEGRIRVYIEALLRSLIADDIIVAYSGVTVTADAQDKTTYDVEYFFQPITEITHVKVTQKLVYSLA